MGNMSPPLVLRISAVALAAVLLPGTPVRADQIVIDFSDMVIGQSYSSYSSQGFTFLPGLPGGQFAGVEVNGAPALGEPSGGSVQIQIDGVTLFDLVSVTAAELPPAPGMAEFEIAGNGPYPTNEFYVLSGVTPKTITTDLGQIYNASFTDGDPFALTQLVLNYPSVLPIPPPSVPEPSTLVLAVIAACVGLGVLGRRPSLRV